MTEIISFTKTELSGIIEETKSINLFRFCPPAGLSIQSRFCFQTFPRLVMSGRSLMPPRSIIIPASANCQKASGARDIRKTQSRSSRDNDGSEIVPHNLFLLTQFRCHPIRHLEQTIGCVIGLTIGIQKGCKWGMYCLKSLSFSINKSNSSMLRRALRQRSSLLQSICRLWRHHICSIAITFKVHLSDQKGIFTGTRDDASQRIELPLQLEKESGATLR
jgi:hypothetical protein